MEGARIYAQNVIREKNQSLNFLRLGSRVDAVAARLETAIRMQVMIIKMIMINIYYYAKNCHYCLRKIVEILDIYAQASVYREFRNSLLVQD
jgi:division protein CdvB (Snf7/Vps24/ESCRT-III family)